MRQSKCSVVRYVTWLHSNTLFIVRNQLKIPAPPPLYTGTLPLPPEPDTCPRADLTQNLNSITHSQALKTQNGLGYDDEPASPEPLGSSASSSPSKLKSEPVPHYLSKTTYIQNHTFRRLFGLSIFFSFTYFALRVVYIAMNKVKVVVNPDNASAEALRDVERQNRAALVYSTIILFAELGGFILVHVGQQMFTRQKTKFGKMPDVNVAKMKQVTLAAA